MLPQILPQQLFVKQFLNSIRSFPYLCHIHQRLFNVTAQQPGSHCRLGLVQNAEQRTPFFLVPHRLGKLQIPPGRRVKEHKRRVGVNGYLPDMRQLTVLRLVQIVKHRTDRKRRHRQIL